MGIASFPALFATWTSQARLPLPTSCTAQGQEHGDSGSPSLVQRGAEALGHLQSR